MGWLVFLVILTEDQDLSYQSKAVIAYSFINYTCSNLINIKTEYQEYQVLFYTNS